MNIDDLADVTSAEEFLALDAGRSATASMGAPHGNKTTSTGENDAMASESHGEAVIRELIVDAQRDANTAVQGTIEDERDLRALARVKVQHPHLYEILLSKLRTAGVRAKDLASLTKSVNGFKRFLMAKATSDHSNSTLMPGEAIAKVLPGAPVGRDIVEPTGWRVHETGIYRVWDPDNRTPTPQGELVTAAPIIIVARLIDAEHIEHVRIAFPRNGHWQYQVVERQTIATARLIVALSAVGVAVTSGNASQLVTFLAAYEAVNIDSIPVVTMTRKLGWQPDNTFLLGENVISANATAQVTFVGNDVGDKQAARKYQGAGSLDAWKKTLASVSNCPRVLAVVYAGFSAVLLTVLRAPNFVIEIAGGTSGGKTSTCALAGSAFGHPDQHNQEPPSVISTWDATRVYLERTASLLVGLPMFVDDTKRAEDPRKVVETVYDIASGQGRGRGSINGTASVMQFRTVLVITGEESVVEFSQAGGLRGRVVSLWGSPFGKTTTETRELVNNVWESIRTNYGLAGPAFVRFVVDNTDRWPEWRKRYDALRAEYETKAGGNAIVGRLAAYVATIHISAELVHEALGFTWDTEKVMAALWDVVAAQKAEVDRPAAALQSVIEWAIANQANFYGRHDEDKLNRARGPNGGWAGRWDKGDEYPYIAFVPQRLDQILASLGYDSAATRRTWFDRGWLKTADKRHKFRVRIEGEPMWTVAIRKVAILAADGSFNSDSSSDKVVPDLPFADKATGSDDYEEVIV